MRFLIGLIGILAGFAMIRYTEQVLGIVGRWNWAEKWFPTGGTRTGIKLVGILLMVIFFVYMTGTLESLLMRMAAPIIGIEV